MFEKSKPPNPLNHRGIINTSFGKYTLFLRRFVTMRNLIFFTKNAAKHLEGDQK